MDLNRKPRSRRQPGPPMPEPYEDFDGYGEMGDKYEDMGDYKESSEEMYGDYEPGNRRGDQRSDYGQGRGNNRTRSVVLCHVHPIFTIF